MCNRLHSHWNIMSSCFTICPKKAPKKSRPLIPGAALYVMEKVYYSPPRRML